MIRKRIRRTLAWIACVILLAFVFAVWTVGSQLVAPACRPVGTPPDDLPITTTLLKSDSGSQIATWYVPCAEAKATIVLLHGIRGDRRSMLGHARLLHDEGYAIVMIDLQAHGESPGDNITIGYLEQHDVTAAVAFVRKENPAHKIGIIGRSLGGAAALLAKDLNVNAMVLESVYPTIDEAVENRLAMRIGWLHHLVTPALLCQLRPRLGITTSDLRPIEHVGEAGCPLLFASGDLDQHTTLSETKRMFDAATTEKELIIFAGAAHVDLLSHDVQQYRKDVLGFLSKHLNDEE